MSLKYHHKLIFISVPIICLNIQEETEQITGIITEEVSGMGDGQRAVNSFCCLIF